MANRRKKKTTSKRRNAKGSSSMGWFVAGLVIGLVGAYFLYSKGFMPQRPERTETVNASGPVSEPGILEDEEVAGGSESRYDFFTVLPEMEVVVPERELSTKAQPQADETEPQASQGEQFILQVGSFKSAADADQVKARLALLGSIANVQKVTVNNQTWHRVRVGPVTGARQADQLRRQLQDNGIDVLVLKGNG